MAESISSLQVVFKLIGQMAQSSDLSSLVDSVNYDKTLVFGNGTGAGQANMWWHDQRTLAASATEDIDLGGVLTSAFGTTITLTSLKGAFFYASASNNASNNVNVTRPAAAGITLFLAASDGIALGPGDWFGWFCPAANGKTVTATTADLITVTNSAGTNSVTYDVFILGEVA